MTELPSGTVTFLFTDLEGSTCLWEEHGDALTSRLPRNCARALCGDSGSDGLLA